MIRLETLKRNLFLDYKKVEQYLDQSRRKQKGEDISEPIIKTVSLHEKSEFLDNQFHPLSSSTILGSSQTIEFELKTKFPTKSKLFQSMHNKYYDQISTA